MHSSPFHLTLGVNFLRHINHMCLWFLFFVFAESKIVFGIFYRYPLGRDHCQKALLVI